MANAWILPPAPIAGATAAGSSLGTPMHVANDYAGVVWQSSSTGFAELVLDLGRDVLVDSLLVFGCTGLTGGATLQISAARAAAGSAGDYDWNDAALPALAGATMPTGGRGVCLWQAPAAGPPPARFWRLRFQGLGITPLAIARVVIGKRIQLERNFNHGAAFGVRDLGAVDFSRRGVLLRTRGAKLRTLGLTFANVRRDEVIASVQPLLERIGNTEMIGLVTDPAPSADRQSCCYFGPLVGDLSTIRTRATTAEAKANLVSIF